MATRTSLLLAFLLTVWLSATTGCLDLQAPPFESSGGQAGSSIPTESSSSSGQGGAGGHGANTSSASSSSSSSSTSSSSSSSSSGGPKGLPCNNLVCAPGEVCCYNSSTPIKSQCAANSCPQGTIRIECNSPDDCAAGKCCGLPILTTYLSVNCDTACTMPFEATFCEGTPDACPAGYTCQTTAVLGPGYSVCRQ